MRKFLISPRVQPAKIELAKRTSSIRALLVLAEGRGVVLLRGNEGFDFKHVQASMLKSIKPMIANCDTTERRLLWVYKSRSSAWKLKLHQRKWPGRVPERKKGLELGSRYLRVNLLDDDEIQGFLGQETTHILNVKSPPAFRDKSIDLRRFAASTSPKRTAFQVEE